MNDILPANRGKSDANNTTTAEPQVVHVYPNPSKGELNINFNQTDGNNYTLELTNLLGRTIYKKVVNANVDVLTVSLTDVPNGIYICRVTDQNGAMLFNDKLIIIK